MTTIAEALIEVRADTSKVGSDIQSAASPSKTSKWGAAAGKGLAVGFTAAAGAVLAGGAFLKGAYDEAAEGIRVGRQTAQAIKATGGAANISAAGVSKLSGAISEKVGIDDEAIQSGANLLLTFKNVRNEVGRGSDIFNRATKAAVDLSAGGFGSIEGGSKMLGKALNDPIAGISALSRAGVTFSQKQKDTIKRLVETGDTLKAQKMILKEVESQVGGQGEAQATAAMKAGVAWGNLKETVGTALMPTFERFFGFLNSTAIPALAATGPMFSKIGGYIGPVIGWVKNLFDGFDSGSTMLTDLQMTFSSAFSSIRSTVSSAVTILTVLWNAFGGTLVTFISTVFTSIMGIIRGAFTVIRGIFNVFAGLLRGDWSRVWTGIKQILSGAWTVIKALVSAGWGAIKATFSAAGIALKGIFGRIWQAIKLTAAAAWQGIKSTVASGAAALVSAVRSIPGKLAALSGVFKSAGHKLIDALLDGLKATGGAIASFAESVWSAIKGAINSGIDSLNSLLEFSIDVGPKTFHVNPPNIGHLARGTNSWRGGLTWVGENGPELVNLKRGAQVIPAAKSAAMARGGSGGGGGMGAVRRVAMTITNWQAGTGYMEMIADGAVDAQVSLDGTIGRMR